MNKKKASSPTGTISDRIHRKILSKNWENMDGNLPDSPDLAQPTTICFCRTPLIVLSYFQWPNAKISYQFFAQKSRKYGDGLEHVTRKFDKYQNGIYLVL